MKIYSKILIAVTIIGSTLFQQSCTSEKKSILSKDNLIVRVAEIEVDGAYLSEYLGILNDEARESMAKEPGVLAIFPMQLDGNPTALRILEIYKDQESYESHVKLSLIHM